MLEIKEIDTFSKELEKLQTFYPDEGSKHVIMLLYPALIHYERFSTSFVKIMSNKVKTSMIWGLLFLVIKVEPPFSDLGSSLPGLQTLSYHSSRKDIIPPSILEVPGSNTVISLQFCQDEFRQGYALRYNEANC